MHEASSELGDMQALMHLHHILLPSCACNILRKNMEPKMRKTVHVLARSALNVAERVAKGSYRRRHDEQTISGASDVCT